MSPLFEGSGVALITPFDENGVNEAALREFVEFQIAQGTDALIACGSTGEAATMTPEEQGRVIAVTVEVAAGRVPVVAGVGGSGTVAVGDLAEGARDAGADALLISAPPYNKPTQAGVVAHFRAVMKRAGLPTIIYNVPSRTACNILPKTAQEIADDPLVVGVKEACGDISQIGELCRRLGDRVAIYSGNDDQVVPLLSLGGKGVISVLGNVAPAPVSKMVKLALSGDWAGARAIQLRYLPFVQALFSEPNPIPVKAAVAELGFAAGPARLPLTPPSDATLQLLRQRMDELEIKPRSA